MLSIIDKTAAAEIITRLSICLLLIACGLNAGVAAGQDNQSLSLTLQQLESSYKIETDPAASLLTRLDALEKKAFGSVQEGSAINRIDRLEKNLHPVPSPPAPLTGNASYSRQNIMPNSLSPANTANPGFGINAVTSTAPIAIGDYFPEVMQATQGKTMRFKTMPIAVYITPFPDSRFTDACVKAFVAWEDGSGGYVRFTQISDPDVARIKVIWSHLGINADQTGCTLGAHTITKWQARQPNKLGVINVANVPVPIVIPKFGPKYNVPPQIIEVNLDLIMVRSPDVRNLVLQNIVTHELGHALGLLGHSPVKTDMMYSVTDEYSKLSQRDLNTLRKLYGQNKVDVAL